MLKEISGGAVEPENPLKTQNLPDIHARARPGKALPVIF
jgi:hypothetical protein